jgi:peptidoglycan/LPS O-acetylase OafA/YrhL
VEHFARGTVLSDLAWIREERQSPKVVGCVHRPPSVLACGGVRPVRNGSLYYQIWLNSFAQIKFFAIGGLLALACNRWTPAWRAGFRAAMLCFGIVLCLGASYCDTLSRTGIRPPTSLFISYLLAGCGCVCFFLSCLGSPARWWPKQLLYLGKISYGLYVFHFLSLMMANRLFLGRGQQLPFAEPLKDLLAFAFALGFAAASYKYLEKPFLALKEKFAFVKSRPA